MDHDQFEQRKQDHIALACLDANQALTLNGLDTVYLRHEALPDLDFSELSIQSTRLQKKVDKPFLVSSMTAGHRDALRINRHLIEACAQSKWAMGVGSQRRELTDKAASFEWKSLRSSNKDVELYSNLGVAQLIQTPIDTLHAITEAIGAQALIIHCNPLQESIQPEGTPQFKGCWHALENLVNRFSLPIIVKETGCGFSKSTLSRLNDIGIHAVEVSGLGGTHWGRIERHRAIQNPVRHSAGETFANWGIDTVQSVKSAVALSPNFEIWGSGGVRNGLDAAKLFALGATTVGFAKKMLQAALLSTEAVIEVMETIEYELKVALFCTGSPNLHALQEKLCL